MVGFFGINVKVDIMCFCGVSLFEYYWIEFVYDMFFFDC